MALGVDGRVSIVILLALLRGGGLLDLGEAEVDRRVRLVEVLSSCRGSETGLSSRARGDAFEIGVE